MKAKCFRVASLAQTEVLLLSIDKQNENVPRRVFGDKNILRRLYHHIVSADWMILIFTLQCLFYFGLLI